MTRVIDKAIKRITLGDAEIHQSCTVGLPDPQLETRVWLEGLGDPLDITNNHVVACAVPFTVGIGLNREQNRQAERRRLSVKFRKRDGDQSLFAKVTLRRAETLTGARQELSLFHIRSCENYCRPRPLLLAYELYNAFERWRTDRNRGHSRASSSNSCSLAKILRAPPLAAVRCGFYSRPLRMRRGA